MKLIGIQLKASVWIVHMGRKIPTINSQLRRAKKMERLMVIDGHLPMDISRPSKYLLARGARITATLTSTSYYASPLVQGGLEILCLIKVYMTRTLKNKQIISMYKEMIEALCKEKDGRPVMGSILNCSETAEPADIDWRGTSFRNQTASLKLKTAKSRENETGNTMSLGKDFRTFLKPTANKPKKLKLSPDTESAIILD